MSAQPMASFSIETDTEVLVRFVDGSERLISAASLRGNVRPTDAARIHRSLELRRRFLSRHWPKTLAVLTAVGLMLAALAGGGRWSQMAHPRHPLKPTPVSAADAARPLPMPTPMSNPLPTPSSSVIATNVAPPSSQAAVITPIQTPAGRPVPVPTPDLLPSVTQALSPVVSVVKNLLDL